MSTALSFYFIMRSCIWSAFPRVFGDAWVICENVFRTEFWSTILQPWSFLLLELSESLTLRKEESCFTG